MNHITLLAYHLPRSLHCYLQRPEEQCKLCNRRSSQSSNMRSVFIPIHIDISGRVKNANVSLEQQPRCIHPPHRVMMVTLAPRHTQLSSLVRLTAIVIWSVPCSPRHAVGINTSDDPRKLWERCECEHKKSRVQSLQVSIFIDLHGNQSHSSSHTTRVREWRNMQITELGLLWLNMSVTIVRSVYAAGKEKLFKKSAYLQSEGNGANNANHEKNTNAGKRACHERIPSSNTRPYT